MATAFWPFLSHTRTGPSRSMGRLVAWCKPAGHCDSRTMVGPSFGHSDKVIDGLCAGNDIGVLLFRRHAHGLGTTRATIESNVRGLDKVVCWGVLLGPNSCVWYRARRIETCYSLHPTSVELVSDESASDSLDSCMAVFDFTAFGYRISRAEVLAHLSGAGESAARTLR